MLVVGPGRPDAPTTTGMTSEALAALPVGCEYRSTDGASVGAWVWRKRPTGWVVAEGDTGWIDMSGHLRGAHGGGDPVALTSGRIHLKRTNNTIVWRPNRATIPPAGTPAFVLPPGLSGEGAVIVTCWDNTMALALDYEVLTSEMRRLRPASGIQSPWGKAITSITPAHCPHPWPTSLPS